MTETERDRAELTRLQRLPFSAKVTLTNARIREFYSIMLGKVYVSFSGGKDSTVLLDLVRRIYPEVPAVFCDTGLEFPEIREFVKSFDNVEIIKPDKPFKRIIEEEGFPVISKDVSRAVKNARRGNKCGLDRFVPYGGRYDLSHYSYLIDAPFAISDDCCYRMKKKPFHQYYKRTGRRPYMGMRTEESMLRTQQWQKTGCINSNHGREAANPLAFWRDEDVERYIQEHKLPLSAPYAMGYKRTGCVFCMFGIHLDNYPNRIQRLQRTHPKLYAYCMSEKGLNMRPICEFIGIPWRDPNSRIEDFPELELGIDAEEVA